MAAHALLRRAEDLAHIVSRLENRLEQSDQRHQEDQEKILALGAKIAALEKGSATGARKVLFSEDDAASRQLSAVSKVFEVVATIDFDKTDPGRINDRHMIFDVTSLYAWISEKRKPVLEHLQQANAAKSVSLLESAIEEIVEP